MDTHFRFFFFNNTKDIVILGCWNHNLYEHKYSMPYSSLEIYNYSVGEWIVYSRNYEKLGKFNLRVVYNDNIGYLSSGITRTIKKNEIEWRWNG